jgi:imidazoleglycerol phosphate synthase glutamine amidotransferase subunit HisH
VYIQIALVCYCCKIYHNNPLDSSYHRNAIKSRGYEIEFISTAADISSAKVIVFPGVGIFGQAMEVAVVMMMMMMTSRLTVLDR